MRTMLIFFAALLIVSCSDNSDTLIKRDLEGSEWEGYHYVLNGNSGFFDNDYIKMPRYLSFSDDGLYTFDKLSGNCLFRNETLVLEGIQKTTILDYQNQTMVLEFVVNEGDLYRILSRNIYMIPGQKITLKQYFRRID